MPDDTTILSLPLILPAQAQKHVTHNEALVKLDLIVQLAVINRTLTTPPALPAIGDRHIVAAGATGPWTGQAGRIAMFTEAGWQFTQPLPGWQAYVMAESQMAFYNGLTWIALSDGPFTVGRLGVSATPDATNRLAVSSPATLLNHAGSGHQLKLNKAAASDTASLLFQTGFGGRAEMGTAGADDFSVKVSADGGSWSVALISDAATGEVTLPQPLHLGGQASDPAAPVDGTLWLNTTTGEVKVRSAGVTQVVGGGGGGGVSDGDKGDITVSGAGTIWTIDAGAVTLDKLANIATNSFLGRDSAGTGAPEVLTPAQARAILNVADGANNYAHPNHSGDVTSTGDGATTIANDVVTNAKLADMASGTLKGRSSAGSGDPEDLTGTQATALLDTFTSGAKGLAPASGGGTTNFLRADGTWAAPPGGGGGSPGGASGTVQFNDAGSFGGAADVEIEGGQLRLPTIATPAVPAADGVKLFGRKVGGRSMPAFMGPSGLDSALQPSFARNKIGMFMAAGNGGTDTAVGIAMTGTGTATSENVGTSNLHNYMRRRSWLVTTASTTAVAGLRGNALQWTLGGPSAELGGFHLVWRWGPATGVATSTHRVFVGMRGSASAPSDVNPSTLTNICGMGYDAGDTNIQFMHNDGSGTATKIDLGSGFPKPNADRTAVYEIALFAPPGTTQSLGYEVTNLVSGAVATGTVTTDLPSATQLLTPYGYISVGGTNSVIGFATMGLYIESDY
ncbi:DUF2793 domain-containing protein [Rhodobacter calidifons]|uniref:DUF2793 domain-containing protein n=1 Tax=Rhodobacter calidifons TaxID=2715277 RepID=A0ABX0G5G9_9RHOB|nr:DUF2793 domain-containing protein [Rhodobacter calidifons]NHB76094.1 DUF2793 domain-containing protein [Rhodobacter calidifons]